MDLSGPYTKNRIKEQYWIKFKDQYSKMSWDVFSPTKDTIPYHLESKLIYFTKINRPIKYLRCDNAGEQGDTIKELCEAYGISVEYTSPNPPQQNGTIERQFHTDLTRANSMMEAANLKQTTRNILLFEAILTASTVNHICVKPQQTKSPYELFYGKPPKLTVKHLIEFGRIGFVTIHNSIRSKMKPKSIKCIFVGYAPHHTSDTYKMYNPVTGKLILSRDIRWLDWVPYNPISTLPIDAQEPSDTHFLIPETPVHHP